MKYFVTITNTFTGYTSSSPIMEGSESAVEDYRKAVKDNIATIAWFELGSKFWPGDLVRSSCVIEVIEVKE